jgi:hypothetical protein
MLGGERVLAKALYGDLPVNVTNEAAEKCLSSHEINPNRLIHYIELGASMRKWRKDEARAHSKVMAGC